MKDHLLEISVKIRIGSIYSFKLKSCLIDLIKLKDIFEVYRAASLEMYDFTARMYDRQLGRTWQPDQLSDMRSWTSPFSWVQNNPIARIDPTGAIDEPVYTTTGEYRGDTEEGFTGELIIYDGKQNFKEMTKDELITSTKNDEQQAKTYDEKRNEMSGEARANIMTHVLSRLEGTIINGERFSMKRLEDQKIVWGQLRLNNGSKSNFVTTNLGQHPQIEFLDNHTYETTVENMQTTMLVHEWYTHGILKQGSFNFQHAKAYQNVILHRFWNNTTGYYKKKMVENLEFYLRVENNQKLEGM